MGPPLTDGSIPAPHPSADQSPVVLSFKYLDVDSNPKFSIDGCGTEFLRGLIRELNLICEGQICDLAEFNNRRHNHQIEFTQTSEPNGFIHLPEQVEPEVYWQFAVQEHHSWRVHGFFIASVFYIVWLDPEHRLWEGGRN